MTEYQRKLVEDWLYIVDYVIRTKIIIPNKPLQTYEDYYSVGCEAICNAAISYSPQAGEFGPYASRVIYHAIIDYSRSMEYRASRSVDLTTEDGNSLLDLFASYDGGYDDYLDDAMAMQALMESKQRYSGIAKLGIEVLELKMKGYKSSEIAAKYGTSCNNINAWISRARQKLKNDPAFLASLS